MLTFLLVFAGVVGALVLPVVVWCYRAVHVPRRLQEIRRLLTDDVAEAYVELFAPEADADPSTGRADDGMAAQRGAGEGDKRDPFKLVRDDFQSFHAWREYAVAAGFATILIALGLVTCALWVGAVLGDEGEGGATSRASASALLRIQTPLILAFLGGYIWSLYELFTRIGARDLTPNALCWIVVRVIGSVPVGYAFSLLVVEDVAGFAAFAASAFPLRDTRRLLQRQFMRHLKDKTDVRASDGEDRLGALVPGLSDDTLARL